MSVKKLHQASKLGDAIEVMNQINQGVEVNAQNLFAGGYTPLMLAAQGGHLDVVQLLIENGADVNARNLAGVTALMEASRGGFDRIVELLLKNGAEVNVKIESKWGTRKLNGTTALMLAATAGHLNIVSMLIKYGADLNARTSQGATAWSGAMHNNHTSVADLIRKHQAQLVE